MMTSSVASSSNTFKFTSCLKVTMMISCDASSSNTFGWHHVSSISEILSNYDQQLVVYVAVLFISWKTENVSMDGSDSFNRDINRDSHKVIESYNWIIYSRYHFLTFDIQMILPKYHEAYKSIS